MPELLKPYNPTRAPRTMNQLLPQTLRSRLKSRGDGVFSVEAPDLILSCSKDLPSLLKTPFVLALRSGWDLGFYYAVYSVYFVQLVQSSFKNVLNKGTLIQLWWWKYPSAAHRWRTSLRGPSAHPGSRFTVQLITNLFLLDCSRGRMCKQALRDLIIVASASKTLRKHISLGCADQFTNSGCLFSSAVSSRHNTELHSHVTVHVTPSCPRPRHRELQGPSHDAALSLYE